MNTSDLLLMKHQTMRSGFGDSLAFIPAEMYDYDASSNMIYYGIAPQGLPITVAGWIVTKYTYDGSNRLTQTQVLQNIAWSNRTTANWL